MAALKSKFMVATEDGGIHEDRPMFNVENAKSRDLLGMIFWYEPWHGFVFRARNENCLFSWDCLKALSDFCRELTEEDKGR